MSDSNPVRPGSASPLLSFLLESRRALALFTVAYVVIGLGLLSTDTALHDEGLFTVDWSIWASRDLFPVLFFQKAKPVLAVLYLVPSLAGDRACLVAHLLVAASAIPLLAGAARAMGISCPNVAAIAVAASPIYFLGGASGVSNTDGVVGMSLVLYLVARKKHALGGVVLGALPWVRHELALFVAVMVLHALLVDRKPRFVLGALAFPLAYSLAGALYHHDALWLLHYPPTTAQPMPNNPVWEPVTARQLSTMLVGVSPLFGLAFAIRWRQLSSLERTLLCYAAGWLLLVGVLPIWRIANFGFVPRYALVVLPIVALLSSRVAAAWAGGEKATLRDALVPVLYGCVWIASGFAQPEIAAPMVVAWVAALVAARRGQRDVAVAALSIVALGGPLLPVRTEMRRSELAPYLPEMIAWLREAHPPGNARRVYTNSPLLALYASGAGDLPGLDVRFLVGADQQFDLVSLSDEANGQRAAIQRLVVDHFNGGRAILPSQLSPESVPDDALFVLRRDRRVEMLLPAEVWGPHLLPVFEGSFRALRFVR